MPAAVGRKRMAAPRNVGRYHLPNSTQQWPHTMQFIPLSALLVPSTELCRSKARINSWSFPAPPTGACGHEVQLLQPVSHPVCSPLSVPTTVLLCRSISFSCSWAKVSHHGCSLVRSISLTTAPLPDSES